MYLSVCGFQTKPSSLLLNKKTGIVGRLIPNTLKMIILMMWKVFDIVTLVNPIFMHLHNHRWAFTDWVVLTHWGRVTHICVRKLTIIGLDNGLLPGRCQAISLTTNAAILLIRKLGTNSIEILNTILTFSFKKMHLKMLAAKWRPFFLGVNVLCKVYAYPPACDMPLFKLWRDGDYHWCMCASGHYSVIAVFPKHQIETSHRYWPFVRGIPRSPVDSPHKYQWCGVWCFLWSAAEQTMETPVIWDAIALIIAPL